MNGHNVLWGNESNDARGELIEDFNTMNDICLMNDKSYTYIHPTTHSFTSIDLSLCLSSISFSRLQLVCQ